MPEETCKLVQRGVRKTFIRANHNDEHMWDIEGYTGKLIAKDRYSYPTQTRVQVVIISERRLDE